MQAVPTWLIWLIAAAALAGAEVLSLGLVLIMFAVGAVAAAAVAALNGPVLLQAVVFAVVSVALLVLVRPAARRRFTVAHQRTGIDALSGASALVLEPVDSHSGRVKIGGEVWSARVYDDTQTLSPGEQVQVMEISGATALVWRQP
ncbi:MAG: NfeD family protein [Actinomycetota bacterium]|nr:NfeD family protein [Actinomycetota bacterium]